MDNDRDRLQYGLFASVEIRSEVLDDEVSGLASVSHLGTLNNKNVRVPSARQLGADSCCGSPGFVGAVREAPVSGNANNGSDSQNARIAATHDGDSI